jgi:tetratricopeptide (TPR) repeat protein
LNILEQVLDINSTFNDAKVYMAINYIDLEKYDDALSFTNEILEDMPQHENALYYK